ncbi:AI-2E family transporter [Natronoflexus pectinivorans]|uniref:Putative PurR-regulated permease PerM n=1 Tax=Natronoflexus pectinivorans TaxID=682526 RepID=A0A4R2GP01_9BACT|nr:AI-2E family transporter [Natronoflexus pectinivorans]TCO11065.1 putative PurR-regulated permease PerM [Natronoflexus pectinivorans]
MNQLKKTNRILIFFLLIVVFLYLGAPFLIPFIFGIFFAFLMVPLCKFLEKIKLNRTIAALLSTLVVFIIFGGILFLFITQINLFVSDMPSMEDKVMSLIKSGQNRIEAITNISLSQQDEILEERSGQIIEKIEPFVTNFFGNVLSTVFSFFLVLIYLFLLLLYRKKIFDFLMMYVSQEQESSTKETLSKISHVAFHYLWGRAKVMILLGIMFFITFILFGLPYALLFTLFGAVITIIPYFGPLLSGLLPILFSFIYFDSLQKILIFSSIVIVIQLIESYVLEPLILGKEVEINPLVIIVTIVVGGIIWGLAGMILFVPIIAMVKIISLNQSKLRPIGFLLGQRDKDEFKK